MRRLISEGPPPTDPRLAAVAGSGGALGRGGMTTKVARRAVGGPLRRVTVIANGRSRTHHRG